jgi:hypothetical protein
MTTSTTAPTGGFFVQLMPMLADRTLMLIVSKADDQPPTQLRECGATKAPGSEPKPEEKATASGLMLGTGFPALRIHFDVAEEFGKRVRA